MTPTDKFVGAMRWLIEDHVGSRPDDEIHDNCGLTMTVRKAVEAFADTSCLTTAGMHIPDPVSGSCNSCRVALLKRVME